jgi:diguanylate cyclase (GGDEF)-like protein
MPQELDPPPPIATMDSAPLFSRSNRTARRTILATIGGFLALAAVLTAERAVYARSASHAAELTRAVAEVSGEVLREDEILTMSANMYAATGDVKWKERYTTHLPVIDTAIARAMRLAPADIGSRFSDATKVANDALVAMETNAFAAVERGDLPAAQREMQSENYTRYKNVLAAGQEDFAFELKEYAAGVVAGTRRLSWALAALAVLAIGGVVTWLWARLIGELARVQQEYHTSQEQLSARHALDRLTGLPNRQWVTDQLERKMADRSRSGGRFAALEIGVDDLRLLNDTVSHAAGDDVLVEFSQRLQRYVRQDELVARLEGDHFLVVLTVEDEGRGGVARAAERLLDVLGEPVQSMRFGELLVTASIGISLYPDSAVDVDDLLRRAQLALQVAKREGRGFARFFRQSMLASEPQAMA